MAEPLLEVRDLKTYFDTRRGPVKAVDGISYNVMPGEIVALVGESGCGKTVSALSLLRLIPEPPGKVWAGEAMFEGKDLLKLNKEEIRQIRGNKISVIFQEPMTSLNPVFTIGRQITETMVEHKVVEKEKAYAEASRLLELVGIPDAERLKQYPMQFSGGMRQRVMIAMALSCNPRLIIADEPTTAVDVTIQAQLLELLDSVVQRFNAAILLITHNLGMVAKYAERVNVMYAGRIVEQATCEEIFANPLHPYTRMLLNCSPRLDRDRQTKLIPIQGQPPDLVRRPPGCPFHPRCYCTKDVCTDEWPPLVEVSKGHTVACPYCDGG
ncbi:MAG: ABC transporter ATP-binding protein [Dehalococcoidia bacterium]|nr:MAG: ABC transporter ATP-binding protein [Dehalococcoidia bacterium]